MPRPPLLHRVTPEQLWYADLGLAALLVLSFGHDAFGLGRGRHPVYVALLIVAAGLGVAIRRRTPMFALVLIATSLAVTTMFGESWPGDPLIAIPIYQVASTYARRQSLEALVAVAFTLVLAASIAVAGHHSSNAVVFGVVVATAAWFIGDSVRVRRTYVAGLAEQAAQRQREVVERAQRSLAEERLQIARELHDVVAHSLSVIAVQSGVGRHVIDKQPEEAKKALAAVEATSRSALDELRRMLGVLRRDDGGPASLGPAPNVLALEPLVDQVRAAGYVINLDVRSAAVRDISAAASLSLYRIVQEALTNVVRHAGPATVNVEIRDELDELVVEVNDNGHGIERAANAPGLADDRAAHHGLVGMRERVALFGGSFSAGSSSAGGFRVLARFPLKSLQPS